MLRTRIELEKKKIETVGQTQALWNGYRKFQVARKVRECDDVHSFYLQPHDGKPPPPFKPGQYLTFQLKVPGVSKPIIRCYSLSDCPEHPDCYRVTIKKALPPAEAPHVPPGLGSSYFSDVVKEGDILDVKAPNGNFTLDLTQERPLVLIGGGVGVTPMLAMLNAIVAGGSKREVWFFFGGRNRAEHIQKEHLEEVAKKFDNVRLHVCYSRPAPEDVAGRDFQHSERISVGLLKKLLPSNNYDFFICGPPPLMESLTEGLRAWGVPDQNVFFEAFGPATVKRVTAAPPLGLTEAQFEIEFSRSARKMKWQSQAGNLLDFARAVGVKIESGCRAGSCGTCLVAIKSGQVDYLSEPGEKPEEGSCLTCICKPRTNLVLDA